MEIGTKIIYQIVKTSTAPLGKTYKSYKTIQEFSGVLLAYGEKMCDVELVNEAGKKRKMKVRTDKIRIAQ
jgi:uncharacterized lipoprotein YajG